MWRKEHILAAFRNEWNAIEKNFRANENSNLHNDIHDARLHFKKMRSILALCGLKHHLKKAPIKEPGISETYTLLGEIRNRFIARKILKKELNLSGELLRNIKREERNYILLLNKEKTSLPARIRSFAQTIEADITNIDFRTASRFIKRNRKKLALYFEAPLLSPDRLHEARKQIKTLYYSYAFLPEKMRKKIKLNTRYCDGLQKIIGDWNDLEITLHYAEHFSPANKTLKDTLYARQEVLYDKIKKRSRNFLRKTKRS